MISVPVDSLSITQIPGVGKGRARAHFGGIMAVFFRSSIDENIAFSRLEAALLSGQDFDGYFSVHGELPFSWPRDMSADEFRQKIVDSLRSVWARAPFWAVYERSEQLNNLTANEITIAAIQLSANYPGALVATLSLLGRKHNSSDLELTFVCFMQDTERRNFRARYEGKFISL